MMCQTEKLERAIWCKGMCESIICYDFVEGKSADKYVDGNRYLDKYVEDLGRDTVIVIMQNVLDNVERIDVDVATDSEGVSYNHIEFKDGYVSEDDLKKSLYDLWNKTIGYKG